MNTFKTAVVVVVLLGIGYGGWKLVNGHWKLVSSSDGTNVLPGVLAGDVSWHPDGEYRDLNQQEAPPFDPEADDESNGLAHLGNPVRPVPGGQEAPAGAASRGSTSAHQEFPIVTFGPPDDFGQPGPVDEGEISSTPGKFGTASYEPPLAPPVGGERPFGGAVVFPHAQPYTQPDAGQNGQIPIGGSPAVATSEAFAKAWRTGLRQIEQDQLKDALYTLSAWLGSPDLTPVQSQELQQLLDQLAGTVVYSTEHLMEPAYVVRRGERLQDIAAQYHVPWQLLAKINGLDEPYIVLPAQRLKVVKGPFAARVDLQQQQIFLYLRGYYAGRFAFTAGLDQPPRPGTYQVVSRMEQRTWYDAAGYEVPPEHPDNPYGPYWIDLGSNQCLHGAAASGADRGCVSVAPRDAGDLYGILAVGSQVIIR